jgi:hypothetical protein
MYTDDALLQILKDFYQAHGRAPLSRELKQGKLIRKRFSWKVALELAGVPSSRKTHYTENPRRTTECLLCGKVTARKTNICIACTRLALPGQYRTQRKLALVKYLGGRCLLCGYSKNLAALVFHHVDPRNKSENIAAMLTKHPISKLDDELSKCVLVCNNCHVELHNAELDIEKLEALLCS